MSGSLLERYYRVIANKNMFKILVYLGERKSAKATVIIRDLKFSPGSFYDALRKMEGIVTKNKDGEYILTDDGVVIYNMVLNDRARISVAPRLHRFLVTLLKVKPLFPVGLFRYYSLLPLNFRLTTLVAFILVNAVISGIAGFIPMVLYGWPILPNFTLSFIIYILNFLMVTFLLGSVTLILGRQERVIDVVSKMPLIMWPQTVYMLVTWYLREVSFVLPRLTYQVGLILALMSTMYMVTVLYSDLEVSIEISMVIALGFLAFSLAAVITYILQLFA